MAETNSDKKYLKPYMTILLKSVLRMRYLKVAKFLNISSFSGELFNPCALCTTNNNNNNNFLTEDEV